MRRHLKAGGLPRAFLPDDWGMRSDAEKKKILRWTDINVLRGSPYRNYMRAIKKAMRKADVDCVHGPLPKIIDAELK